MDFLKKSFLLACTPYMHIFRFCVSTSRYQERQHIIFGAICSLQTIIIINKLNDLILN